MSIIHRWLRKQDFNPSVGGIFVNPFYILRSELWNTIEQNSHQLKGKILDVGCGRKPYQSLFSFTEYVGVDVEQSGHPHHNDSVDVYFDGQHLPFPKASFDSMISTEVLEHVFEPEILIKEMHRVLKPGGKLLLTTPFMWDEHEVPYDYGRYSSYGLRHLLRKHGFTILKQEKLVNDVSLFAQLFISYLYKMLVTKNQIWNMAVFIFLMAPITLIGLMLGKVLPNSTDLYLGNLVLARRNKKP